MVRRTILGGIAALAAVTLLLATTEGNPSSPSTGAAVAGKKYIGAKKCKNCHSTDESGNQYGHWEKGPHAKAWETLASDEAKKAAAAVGIDDPQKSDKCIKCHMTAFGVDAKQIKKGFDPEAGVQCESCHGPGDKHMMARMMAAAEETEGYPEIDAEEIESGVAVETCLRCHNDESPSYKPFCPQVRGQALRHLNPKKPRTDEEKAALELKDPTKSEDCMKCHKDM